jgi:putative endonuclease
MEYYVYVLKSCNRQYRYIGISDNVERRIQQHNKGYNRTTKPYAPFELILSDKYTSRIEARRKEKYLKSGIGRQFLDNLVSPQ